MTLGIGIDIVCISAFEKLIADSQSPFITDHFTQGEISYAKSTHGSDASHLAARYASKEATVKALEEIHLFRPKLVSAVNYREIEVMKDPYGRPYLMFHGAIKRIVTSLEVRAHVSLSHDGDYAVAQVVLS